MNGKDCLLSCAGIVVFWGPLEERSSLRWSVRAGFGMAFLALRGFWGIWSETSEEFHHSHFVSCVLSRSVVSDSLWHHGPTRLLFPFNSPGKNTGVSCHSLFQGIFLTQGTPVLCANSLPSEPSGKPYLKVTWELCRPNACVLVT